MKAGEKTQKEEDSLSSAAMRKSAGVSFLEALFIGLTLMALIGGGLVHTIQKTYQTKISTVTENGEAIAQWLRSAYLLKQSARLRIMRHVQKIALIQNWPVFRR